MRADRIRIEAAILSKAKVDHEARMASIQIESLLSHEKCAHALAAAIVKIAELEGPATPIFGI